MKRASRSAAVAMFFLWFVTAQLACSTQTKRIDPASAVITKQRLPDIPAPLGLAGAYSGTCNGALLVAGGSNFLDTADGKKEKTWHDDVYVLDPATNQWQTAGKLDQPLGYGVSVTTNQGIVCVGGCDSKHGVADVFLLRWNNGKLGERPLPPLPQPTCYAAGAMVGNTIFVAGGTDDATTLDGSRRFWAMDLAASNPQWRELPAWPGPERFYAMAGSNGHAFYLFCGMHGVPDSATSATSAPSTSSSGTGSKTHLEYLNDAYEYTPGKVAGRDPGTWRKLADIPHAAGAGPTPAATIDNNTLVLFGGGVDGNKEMPHTNYVYDIAKNTWTAIGPIDAVRCAVGVVPFRGGFVIPSGEYAPGKRSAEVWMYKWQPRQ